jgi:glyoxylase-like metal-dependent hydrolase (beta-lactamase superfamily II)
VGQVEIESFFDRRTFSVSYVVHEPASGHAVVIDSVRDYEPRRGRLGSESADRIAAFVRQRGLTVDWHLETHVHADHFTAAAYLKEMLGGRIAIGAGTPAIQQTFARLYNLESGFRADGSQFDRLLAGGDRVAFGGLRVEVIDTPGHTPVCISYRIGDALFCGDTMFMPDYGTARCDFPGGSARGLYRSIRRLLALPPETRVFVGHDYGSEGRDFAWQTTVAAQRAGNIHVRDGVTEDEFVALREGRDATLDLPELMLAAIQLNVRAGRLPPAEANGVSYLKVPLNVM